MLTPASLAVSLLVLSAEPTSTPDSSCEPAFASRFAPLEQVFKRAASFRAAVQGGKTSFTELVKQGAQLQKLAAKEQEKIQSTACGLGPEETPRFDACVSPIQWSCESIPPSIDWSLLERVTKSEDEALAYTVSAPGKPGVGVDLLSEKASFAGGCGDFGCAPSSVALPYMLGEPEKVDPLVKLATRPGLFGQRALQRLEGLGSTLAKATCEGGGWHPESDKEMKAVIEHLESQRAALTEKSPQVTRVRQALQRLGAALKKGLPKEACKLPGGD